MDDSNTDEAKWECMTCPEGASCQKFTSKKANTTIPKFGWSACTATTDTARYDKCLFAGACLGARNDKLIGKFAANSTDNLENVIFLNDDHGNDEKAKLKDLIKKNNGQNDPALWCSDLVGSIEKDLNKTCIVGWYVRIALFFGKTFFRFFHISNC